MVVIDCKDVELFAIYERNAKTETRFECYRIKKVSILTFEIETSLDMISCEYHKKRLKYHILR